MTTFSTRRRFSVAIYPARFFSFRSVPTERLGFPLGTKTENSNLLYCRLVFTSLLVEPCPYQVKEIPFSFFYRAMESLEDVGCPV